MGRILESVIMFGLLPIVILGVLVLLWRNPFSIDSFLKVAGLILSWPVLVSLIALFFMTRYRESIDYFLRHIRSVSFPGGNVQTQNPGPSNNPASHESTAGSISLSAE